MLRILLAVLHLSALGIGLGAVWARATALSEQPVTANAARRAFAADTWWGVAALLWISTGVWRLLAGTEKATAYYMHNHVFFAKMGLFLIILALETSAAIALNKWRRAAAANRETWQPDAQVAARIKRISRVEAMILLVMIGAAVMMARGYGAGA